MRLTRDPHIHPLVFGPRSQSYRKMTTRFETLLLDELQKSGLRYDDIWHWAKHNPEDHWIGVRKYERPEHSFSDDTPGIGVAKELYKAYILPFSFSWRTSSHEEVCLYMEVVGHTSCGVSKGSTRDWATDGWLSMHCLRQWNIGPRHPAPFADLTKEEVRLKVKPTRNVNVADHLFKYVGFRLFKKYKEATMAHCGEDHSSIGVDCFYGGWERLYSQFSNPAAFDVVGMDSRLAKYVLRFIYEVRCDYGYWTELEQRWLWWFYKNTVHSYILMFDGSVYIKEHGMPSGSPMTSRDDTDYSIFCVCLDQARTQKIYPFQCFGDNILADRTYDSFMCSFSDVGVDFTDEQGEFLGRVVGRLECEGGTMVSFVPSQFSKHVTALRCANIEVWKHLMAITAHARNWALSKKHYDFFRAYFNRVVDYIIAEGEEGCLVDNKVFMPTWHDCLCLHMPCG